MAVEVQRFPLDVQQKFAVEYSGRNEVVEPDILFTVEDHRERGFGRLYMGPSRTGKGFGIRAAAFYDNGSDLPTGLVVLEIDQDGTDIQREIRFSSSAPEDLQIVGIKGNTEFMAYYIHGELYSTGVGTRFSTNDYYWSPYIAELEYMGYTEGKIHDILTARNTQYDRSTGVVTFRPKGYVLRAPKTIDRDKILDQLFTPELRANPKGANSGNDLWRNASWMEIFGVSWKQLVEQDVFPSK